MPVRATTSAPSPQLPRLERGKLIRVNAVAEAQGATADTGGLPTAALVFQYNPSTITRSRTGRWETRTKRNEKVATAQEQRAASGSGSANLLAESETISLKVTFDATEMILNGEAKDGILPELAFLESASLGKIQERRKQGGDGSAARTVRPDEMLLVLGPRRAFPVVMTGLTITEQKFAPDLTPIRAEVDLKFNVLEPVDVAYNTWVATAFDQIVSRRTSLSATVEEAGTVSDILSSAVAGAGSGMGSDGTEI
ncbi:hypothetical protein [Mesorhizobium sp. CN2-181]|uniref:CIS tube protein n=1 Tax=Mesorhizobium yinganensis TaxID=3157707 RepID=UPI0032B80686